jgi:hypothetical protein
VVSVTSCNDLDHLIPSAQKTAQLPNAERIARIRADRWIGYTQAQKALAKLEELFTHPERQRMPNLLIVGPTNNGKTMLVEKFRRQHPVTTSDDGQTEQIPILAMQMPSDPTISRFYTMLLYSLNAPNFARRRVSDLEELSLRILRQVGLRMLVIDELHNVLAGSGPQQRQFLNLLRFLGNELRIPLVCVGTKEAYLAIRSDDQLENRFEPFSLPLWTLDDEFSSLLASFAAVLPLRRASQLHLPDIAHYILSKSEGTIGEITTLLTRSAILAVETGSECIDRQILGLVDYSSPTERRRTFERELA